MRIAKWGAGLAIRLPAVVVEALQLKPGDEVEVHAAGERALAVARKPKREEFLNQLRGFRGRPPADFKFERGEANERRLQTVSSRGENTMTSARPRSMKPAAAPSALKVQAALGNKFEVLEFDATTRTAADAAAAIGCTVAEIAKSLIFRGLGSNRPVLVVASGVNRVDEAKVADAVGEKIARADADFVREATGFAIGGVPPVGHDNPPIVLIDQSLMTFAEIWAAAGTPNAVFRLTPSDLVHLTGGRVVAISRQ